MKKVTSTEYHDEMAGAYDTGYQGPLWEVYNAVTWNYIKEYLPQDKKNARVLDAGGGTGIWAVRIADLGYQVVLTDISKGMLNVAREKIRNQGLSDRITVVESDITDMKEFRDNSFGLVLAEGDPVSYCDDPEKAVKELSRVVRPGGHVTISVDNKMSWGYRCLKMGEPGLAKQVQETSIFFMPGKRDGEGYPAHMFTIEELVFMIARHGLTPVKTVGKLLKVWPREDLEKPELLSAIKEFEVQYSTRPSVAGSGGHIAIVGRKQEV